MPQEEEQGWSLGLEFEGISAESGRDDVLLTKTYEEGQKGEKALSLCDCGSTQSGKETPDPTAARPATRDEVCKVRSLVDVVTPSKGLKRSATVCMDLAGVDTLLTKALLDSKAKRRKPLVVNLAPATFSFQGPSVDRRSNICV